MTVANCSFGTEREVSAEPQRWSEPFELAVIRVSDNIQIAVSEIRIFLWIQLFSLS